MGQAGSLGLRALVRGARAALLDEGLAGRRQPLLCAWPGALGGGHPEPRLLEPGWL